MRLATASRVSATHALGVVIGALVAGGIAFSAPANADESFVMCPDGRSGVAEGRTTCAFAENVEGAYWSQGGPLVEACSPVTGECYTMQCQPGFTATMIGGAVVNSVRCVGGDDAVVILW